MMATVNKVLGDEPICHCSTSIGGAVTDTGIVPLGTMQDEGTATACMPGAGATVMVSLVISTSEGVIFSCMYGVMEFSDLTLG